MSEAISSDEARLSALFQTLVAQQVNMALVCLGQAPAEGGQRMVDLEGARFFIDVLEMLEVKCKGNLTPQEQTMLRQSLTSLRLAFVELSNAQAAKSRPAQPGPSPETSAPPASASASPATGEGEPAGEPGPDETESRKKFTKKY